MLPSFYASFANYLTAYFLETESTADTGDGFDLGYASDVVGRVPQHRLRLGRTTVNAGGGFGGTLEFQLGDSAGALIAQAAEVEDGLRPVSAVTGLRQIYVAFRANGGPDGIANLNWLQFQ